MLRAGIEPSADNQSFLFYQKMVRSGSSFLYRRRKLSIKSLTWLGNLSALMSVSMRPYEKDSHIISNNNVATNSLVNQSPEIY